MMTIPDDFDLSDLEGLPQTNARRPIYATQSGHLAAPNIHDPARWLSKAVSAVEGYQTTMGGLPSRAAVILALSVAEHETWCGDAWEGEHNWGACQKRVTNAQEKLALSTAGIIANPKNVDAARNAIAAAIAAGNCSPLDREALHVDSSPGKGWYFVYFWAFSIDADGAAFFVDVLIKRHASSKLVVDQAKGVWPLECSKLATSMYAAGYYEGFHERHKMYTQPDGSEISGGELNIRDYANSLISIAPVIDKVLGDWKPGDTELHDEPAPPTPPRFDLQTVKGVQFALAFLAKRFVKPAYDPGSADGVFGPKTKAAVMAYQTDQQLTVDGVVGPRTRLALAQSLGV